MKIAVLGTGMSQEWRPEVAAKVFQDFCSTPGEPQRTHDNPAPRIRGHPGRPRRLPPVLGRLPCGQRQA
jgi:hypothetical protein